jgi:predicted RNase H-related nuclease YkuK (DUF458 family)
MALIIGTYRIGSGAQLSYTITRVDEHQNLNSMQLS